MVPLGSGCAADVIRPEGCTDAGGCVTPTEDLKGGEKDFEALGFAAFLDTEIASGLSLCFFCVCCSSWAKNASCGRFPRRVAVETRLGRSTVGESSGANDVPGRVDERREGRKGLDGMAIVLKAIIEHHVSFDRCSANYNAIDSHGQ